MRTKGEGGGISLLFLDRRLFFLLFIYICLSVCQPRRYMMAPLGSAGVLVKGGVVVVVKLYRQVSSWFGIRGLGTPELAGYPYLSIGHMHAIKDGHSPWLFEMRLLR